MLTASSKAVLLRLIRSRFGDYKQDGQEVKTNCPWCVQRGRGTADTGYKLWINLTKNLYHCWRCDAGGSLSVLFPQMASEFVVSAPEVKKEEKDLEPLPSGLIPLGDLPPNHLVHEYLADRKTTLEEITPYCSFCKDFKRKREDGYEHSFGPRLIFPINQSGRYRGFQGRTIWRNTEPKYVGALGMEKKKLIWGFDVARHHDRIILVEGVFDAIRLGNEGAAIFGKAISDEQIRLLQLGAFKQVIVWLDADAQDKTEETARRLALYFRTYMLKTNQFKDAGETPKDIIKEIVSSNIKRVY